MWSPCPPAALAFEPVPLGDHLAVPTGECVMIMNIVQMIMSTVTGNMLRHLLAQCRLIQAAVGIMVVGIFS